MLSRRSVLFFVFFVNLWNRVKLQECKTYAQPCTSDISCCGGCCLKGLCRDVYLDCRTPPVEDPCTKRFCPEGEVCITYQPPGCKGCGPLPACRAMKLPEILRNNKTLTHLHLLNNGHPFKANYLVVVTFPIIAILFYHSQ